MSHILYFSLIFLILKHMCRVNKDHISSSQHKILNSPELVGFIKSGPFLIFWCIFCKNLQKIGYENEVCVEACRMPNFFLTVLRLFEKILNCFEIRHNFSLVSILSFRKRYICPQKIFGIWKLFKKMWWSPDFQQISTLEPNFTIVK